jgi:hypothetical protein
MSLVRVISYTIRYIALYYYVEKICNVNILEEGISYLEEREISTFDLKFKNN